MPFHQQTLSNGLRVLGEIIPSAKAVALGFFVRTGARDESADESGVTHFLEHMIFKGTEKRDATAVNRDFDRIGAEINAFTSQENTVFHATFLPEYLNEAAEILTDIMRPSLRESDFNTEKSVILDEIARYDVQPGWAAADAARRIYFGQHPLANSILGSPDSINALTIEQMRTYFARRYVTGNIHAVATGNYDWPTLVATLEKHCSHWPAGSGGREKLVPATSPGGRHAVIRPKVAQQYVILNAPGPTAADPRRHAGLVLSVAVGDAVGSRLFWALVDPGHADSAGLGVFPHDAAGTYFLSYSCEPDKAAENHALVEEILAEVQRDGLTDDEIALAKIKTASRIVRESEHTYERMLTVGSDWMYLNEYRTVDEELAAVEAVDAQAIRELLTAYPLEGFTTVTLGPSDPFAA